MDKFFDDARCNLFPKLKQSAVMIAIVGDPDPKLCMEIGAAILFDKPIVVLSPKGRRIPLSLRTIAHRIVEDFDPSSSHSQEQLKGIVLELAEAARLRGRASS